MAQPLWFGPDGSPLFGWLHLPPQPGSHAVVLCPPLGYDAWCSYQTFRVLAETLASAGLGALRFDYDGTGSSAGTYTDPDRIGAWVASVRAAIAELRGRGFLRVSLVGLRFGGALAAIAAIDAPQIDTIVLWDAVLAGKRYARELRAFALAGKGAEPGAPDDGLYGVNGTVYAAATLADIAAIDLASRPAPACARALILTRDDRAAETAYAAKLEAAGIAVAQHAVAGTAAMLETDNEDAKIPQATLALIAGALRATTTATADIATQTRATAVVAPGIVETALRTGPSRMFGILTAPADPAAPRTHLVVMLGGGTEHQIGPGRVWVELARALAARGIASLRADLDGIGDSPVCGPRSVVRPYDPEHMLDLAELVAHGHGELGYGKVCVLGLCAAAWLAIHSALDPAIALDGIFALNPQLFWHQGMEVCTTLAEQRAKELVMREREREGERDGRWARLDALGILSTEMQVLGRVVDERRVPLVLAYAEDDEGLQSMRARNAAPLARLLARAPERFAVAELAGVDHGMHRFRRRPDIYARIERFVRSI